jgi:signal transduction histidine kinase
MINRVYVYIFPGLFVAFLAVWVGITGYTFAAIINVSLPYSFSLLAIFFLTLNIFGLPLIGAWHKKNHPTIQNLTAVITTAAIFVFYWGPFAPAHSFMSLRLDDLQIRWLAFVYIWEVVLVGALVVYLILRTTRFAQQFLDGHVSKTIPRHIIHARIAAIPFRGWMMFVVTVIFGYVIGSSQLYYFSLLPLSEAIKNLANGSVAAVASGLIIFFSLERILKPARQKSGSLVETEKLKGNRFSLSYKMYAMVGFMAVVSIGFFASIAYDRAQSILETDLQMRMERELYITNERWEAGQRDVSISDRRERFGTGGIFEFVVPETQEAFLKGAIFSKETEELLDSFRNDVRERAVIRIDRARTVKIIGLLPVDGRGGHIVGIMFLDDFDRSLTVLLWYVLIITIIIISVVMVVGQLFVKSIIDPIKEIEAAGAYIGRGDFSHHISVHTNDELEDLGRSLDKATRELQGSYIRLEQEVERQTHELAGANERQQKQIVELDETSRRLMRRDEQLEEANARLTIMDEAKTQFVSIAAHQLRTPLSAIKWTFNMLHAGDFGELSSAQEAAVARGVESTDRLISLVGDLLNVARIEAGQVVYAIEKFRIEQVIEKIIEEVTPQANEKHIKISFTKQRRKIPEVMGDAEKIQLALQNIIDNAIAYTSKKGSVKIRIQDLENGTYEVRITDTGIGIPEHQIPLLFQKFFRGENVVKSQIPGTGLGLYVMSNIIHAHGGEIGIESKEGKGTTFIITLPFEVKEIRQQSELSAD